jgi:hypothetical protein
MGAVEEGWCFVVVECQGGEEGMVFRKGSD